MQRGYSLRSLGHFGAEVRDIDLIKESLEPMVIQQIKEDVLRHLILIFKGQGVLAAEEQIRISELFGEIEEAGFEQHPKSPHRKILRVSNDENEGYKAFGTGGWHIDGTFMRKPNAYSIYHIIETPTEGCTGFLPLNEVYEGLSPVMQQRWQRLHMVKTFKRIRGYRDTPGYVIHPLVYPHPATGKWTLCFHQGKMRFFIWDRGTELERKTTKEETRMIIKEIDEQLNVVNKPLQYMHQWEHGDFIVTDNLAVAHWATPGTQLPPCDVGLRVMHRTVIKGWYRPRKPWSVHPTDQEQRIQVPAWDKCETDTGCSESDHEENIVSSSDITYSEENDTLIVPPFAHEKTPREHVLSRNTSGDLSLNGNDLQTEKGSNFFKTLSNLKCSLQ